MAATPPLLSFQRRHLVRTLEVCSSEVATAGLRESMLYLLGPAPIMKAECSLDQFAELTVTNSPSKTIS